MRSPKLKPAYLASRNSWVVNVPVSLSDTGKRRQLFFDTKGEATAACEQLKTRRDNFGVSLTAMTPARIAEAGEAFNILAPLKISLLDAVREFAATHKARSESITFRALFDMVIEAKRDRHPRYLQQLQMMRDRMPQLHNRIVSDITSREIETIIGKFATGSRNPAMRYLKSVFRYGVKRGYLTIDPISRLDFVRTPRREVVTVPNETVSAMLHHALECDLGLIPVLVFGFFCGIRPEGELTKIEWRDMSEGSITIRPEVSKTNRRRFIDLSENANAWLSTYVERGGVMTGKVVAFTLSNLQTRRRANFKGAGIAKWPQQGMRHTFCSNWLAKHQDINKLVLMSGHDSVDTMWRRYHKGVPKAEAERFWSITPPAIEERKIVRLA
jgi:integrase